MLTEAGCGGRAGRRGWPALLFPTQKSFDITPAAHEPTCNDTRYDDRGDCHGHIHPYAATDYVLGARPGDRVQMCSSHGRQAGRKGEVTR